MKGSASLTVGSTADGRAFAVDVHAEPPFAIRRAGGRFLVVGTAAAPVRGDVLALSITVAPGARADVGTVAATIVWPGPDDAAVAPSTLTTTIRVGAGAHLDWRPEPTVSVAGSDHVAETVIVLDEGATCEIVEQYSLGRSGQSSGRLVTDLRVIRGGRTLVRHGESFGPSQPGAGSVAGVAAGRHVLAAVIVGPTAGDSIVELTKPADADRLAAAWLPVASHAGLALAVGPDQPSVLAAWARIASSLAGRTEPV